MAIKLYDLAGTDPDVRFSPYCWRVRMALAHKGLPFTTVPWRHTEKKEIGFSGQGLVPVMVDGDTVVCDSWKIAEYLDKTYPKPPALFSNQAAHAHAYFIKLWAEKLFHPGVMRIIGLDVLASLRPEDAVYFRKAREPRLGTTFEKFVADREKNLSSLRDLLDPVRQTLSQFPFLGGEKPDFSDYIVMGPFQWARCLSDVALLEAGDPILPWLDKMLKLYDGMALNARLRLK